MEARECSQADLSSSTSQQCKEECVQQVSHYENEDQQQADETQLQQDSPQQHPQKRLSYFSCDDKELFGIFLQAINQCKTLESLKTLAHDIKVQISCTFRVGYFFGNMLVLSVPLQNVLFNLIVQDQRHRLVESDLTVLRRLYTDRHYVMTVIKLLSYSVYF